LFVRCFTRPPHNLDAQPPPQLARSNPFAPMKGPGNPIGRQSAAQIRSLIRLIQYITASCRVNQTGGKKRRCTVTEAPDTSGTFDGERLTLLVRRVRVRKCSSPGAARLRWDKRCESPAPPHRATGPPGGEIHRGPAQEGRHDEGLLAGHRWRDEGILTFDTPGRSWEYAIWEMSVRMWSAVKEEHR